MTMTTMTSSSKILFRREQSKIGDLSMALKAIELTRLANPDAIITLRCGNPALLANHPAIDYVIPWEEPDSDADLVIDLLAIQSYEEPKHRSFCEVTSMALSEAGLEPITWDGSPQNLWVDADTRARAYSTIRKRVTHGKRSIGVFWRSDQDFRTWLGMKELVEMLARDGRYSVYCFDGEEKLVKDGYSVMNCVGLSLNVVIAMVSCMDIVITSDSGGIHLAGGLGIPIIGLFGATDPEIVAGMYRDVTHVEVLCKYHPCWFEHRCVKKKCLKRISPQNIYSIVAAKLPYNPSPAPPEYFPSKLPFLGFSRGKEHHPGQETVLVARFRGFGDVGMLLFALEKFREKNPEAHITFLTSPFAASLFYGQEGLVDRVIAMEYNHPPTPGIIPLPIDTSRFDRIYNLINAVDFGDVAHRQPRAANLGDLLGITLDRSPKVRPLVISEAEEAWAKDRINPQSGDIVILCQLDAMGLSRNWSDHHWMLLAELLKDYNRRCNKEAIKIIFTSVKDKHRNLIVPENVFNLSCQTTPRQYLALAWISNIIVCTDSSGLHIGGRVPHAKVIGLFGSTGIADTNEWAHTNYYNNIYPICSKMECSPCWDWQHRSCDRSLHSPTCLWRIKPRIVMAKIRELIEENISIDFYVKSNIRCPKCGSAVSYESHQGKIFCKECDFDKGHFDHMHFLTDRIAIGNCIAPIDRELLNLCKIGAIISVANDFEDSNKIPLPNTRFNLHDSTSEENSLGLFLDAVNQLRWDLAKNNRILVHCMGGGRRSVAVVAWYLSNGNRDKFWEIINKFKEVRIVVKLDGGIHDFLDQYL